MASAGFVIAVSLNVSPGLRPSLTDLGSIVMAVTAFSASGLTVIVTEPSTPFVDLAAIFTSKDFSSPQAISFLTSTFPSPVTVATFSLLLLHISWLADTVEGVMAASICWPDPGIIVVPFTARSFMEVTEYTASAAASAFSASSSLSRVSFVMSFF